MTQLVQISAKSRADIGTGRVDRDSERTGPDGEDTSAQHEKTSHRSWRVKGEDSFQMYLCLEEATVVSNRKCLHSCGQVWLPARAHFPTCPTYQHAAELRNSLFS